MRDKGLIHLYTGDGKGKTTAALGLCLRARGAGFGVLFVQFMKGWDTAELGPLEAIGVEIFRRGQLRKFLPDMTDAERNECGAAQSDCLAYAWENARKFDLLVLDEVISAVTTGMIPMSGLLDFLHQKPKALEIAMTGRDAPEAVSDLADYVSNIRAERHPYEKGLVARKGIEF